VTQSVTLAAFPRSGVETNHTCAEHGNDTFFIEEEHKMAVGRCDFPIMPEIPGIRLGTVCAGIKQNVRDDLLVFEMVEHGSCAAVFTQNAFCAAPVQVARKHLTAAPRWLLINSGNANAGTGHQGLQDALASCEQLAQLTGDSPEQVLPFSTGVIGLPLPIDRIGAALPEAVRHLHPGNWEKAARAIMTTDTFPKGITKTLELDGRKITFNGIAKGAGMIQPNMATMLSFIGTDAKIGHELLQQCLRRAAELSFNRITVDGDTSTNDALVVMASGLSEAPEILPNSEHYARFADTLLEVCKDLAELIVRDGEGATKLIRIAVEEAQSDEEAVRVAKTIAHSPLVKTAFFASDPNWGRILAAVGRAGVDDMVLENIRIFLDDVCIVREGGRADDYTEEAGQEVMDREEIRVTVKLGRGDARQEVLTCDFSYDYVKINAEYRT
jgi:glutamate N-acetyltransferase/amino-acid N-acetyltransferase